MNLLLLAVSVAAATVQTLPVARLVDAVRQALPFPSSDQSGEMPSEGGAQHRWFVVWPTAADPRIVIKANPLHPDTQQASVEAMDAIQRAIEQAERRAQASYDRAIAEVKRTGKPADVDGISLDDEGVAGERIDADLEVSIQLEPATSFELATEHAPVVTPGGVGPSWVVRTAANAYQDPSTQRGRERFRPAEARLYFGVIERPTVARRGDRHLYAVTITAEKDAFCVVIRGNEGLVGRLVAAGDWRRLD